MRKYVVKGAVILAFVIAMSANCYLFAQKFVELGPGPEGIGALAHGVSHDGMSVGGMYYETGGSRATRWNGPGSMDEIPLLPGTDRSVGWGISGDAAYVVGHSALSTITSQRAFRWSNSGGTEPIPILTGYDYNLARATNADGSSVVGIAGNAGGFHAFLWTDTGGVEDLGALQSPLNDSYPYAISDDGSTVVGQGYLATTPRAFRWTAGSGMQELPRLPGTNNAIALGVNDDGSFMVGSSSNPGRDAVLWDIHGNVINLGSFTTEALDLTDDGSMVVGYGFDGAEAAFFWTANDGALNLNDYLPSLGVDLTDWQLERATSITPDGMTIAGYGRKNGVLQSWLFQFAVDGDFSGDGILDCLDADALVAAIANGSSDTSFDLTGDGLIDNADLDQWLTTAGAVNLPSGNAYLRGDANLDGVVDGVDFITWNTNKFTILASWCGGDFNADGVVDGADFIVWNGNKFQTADSASFVPEPDFSLWLLAWLWAGAYHRVNKASY